LRASKDARPGCGRFILRGSLRERLRMTGKHEFAFSRRITPEVLQIVSPSRIQRAQEMPDARCTRGLMCDVH
jgi:hypothetical protein